jgi:hypothetical protein
MWIDREPVNFPVLLDFSGSWFTFDFKEVIFYQCGFPWSGLPIFLSIACKSSKNNTLWKRVKVFGSNV